jgi:outer membrane protein assembly complex protein YaeT
MMIRDRRAHIASFAVRAFLGGLLTLVCPQRAHAQIGESIVAIQVEQEGRNVDDPIVTRLIETRTGTPLEMAAVRETIAHLMNLDRFSDVQVFADRAPAGIVVRYVLVPLHPVDRIEFLGSLGLPEERLRRAVVDRFGASPRAGRAEEIVAALSLEYRRSGYVDAQVTPRVVETHGPDRATLIFDIVAGGRRAIVDVRFNQVDAEEQATIVDRPAIRVGQPYDVEAIDQALRDWEERLHADGLYEARASHGDQIVDDGVYVTVNLARGPRVVVRFAGDALPSEDRERLVPIRAEGSADEDLLEDSSLAIRAFLRSRGYRDAEVPFTREDGDGELVITFNVSRGPLYRVGDLSVIDHTVLSEADLGGLGPIEAGAPFVEANLARVVDNLGRLYRSRGFTQVRLEPRTDVRVPARAADPERQVDVRIEIEEGPRTRVRAVEFEGNAAFDDARLLALTRVAPGQPYADAEVFADRDRIDLEYRNEGYENVAVVPAATFADDTTQADVRFTITEGPRALVDRIIIVGNERIGTDVIERELLLREGEPLGYSALIESRARLVALGLFRRIRIEPLGDASDPLRDVIVDVEESPPTVLGFGGGLEGGFRLRPTGAGGQAEERFELAPRGFFEIGRRNLWGKNRSVNLFTRVSFRNRDIATPGAEPADPELGGFGFNEYRVVGTFREPRLFETSADGLVTAIVEQAIRSSFNFSRREVRAQAGIRLSPVFSVSGRYSFQRTELFDERFTPDEQPLIDRLFPEIRLSKVSGSLIRDSRDDALDAQNGMLIIVDGELAARALGSEVGFAKTYLQGFFYRRLSDAQRVVLALGARIGAAHGFPREVGGDVIQDLPASERFFAGGDSSVRGFSLDRLGDERTITPSGFPTGGNGVIVLNSELRVGLFGPLQGVGFVDAGNVFPRVGDLSVTDLRPAAGVGLMYRSPVGPIRVDLGFNLDPRELVPGTRERRHVLHILLGQAF